MRSELDGLRYGQVLRSPTRAGHEVRSRFLRQLTQCHSMISRRGPRNGERGLLIAQASCDSDAPPIAPRSGGSMSGSCAMDMSNRPRGRRGRRPSRPGPVPVIPFGARGQLRSRSPRWSTTFFDAACPGHAASPRASMGKRAGSPSRKFEGGETSRPAAPEHRHFSPPLVTVRMRRSPGPQVLDATPAISRSAG